MDKHDFMHESKHCEKCLHTEKKCINMALVSENKVKKEGNFHKILEGRKPKNAFHCVTAFL